MLLEKIVGRGDDRRFVRRWRRIFDPDLEIISALERGLRRTSLSRQRQILARRFNVRFRRVEREFRQRHPCFRDARALRKIADKFLKRLRGLPSPLRRLRSALLEKKFSLDAL